MKRPSSSKSGGLTTGLFVAGKCAYVLALFVASDFLHNAWRSSLSSLTTLLLLGSAVVFLTLQRSWGLLFDVLRGRGSVGGSKKEPGLLGGVSSAPSTPGGRALVVCLVNGVGQALALLLFNVGLRCCGPIRAIMMEFADSFLLAIPSLLCGWGSIPPTRRRGLLLVTLAVLLLLFSNEPGAHDAALANAATSGTQVTDNAAVDGTNSAVTHGTSVLGLFQLSEGAVGMGALLLSAALTSVRRGYEKQQSKEFGGRKRLHAVSMCFGGLAMLPLLMLQGLFGGGVDSAAIATTEGSNAAAAAAALAEGAASGSSGLTTSFTLLFLILFYVVLQFYIEAIAQRASDPHLLVKINLLASFAMGAFLDMWRGEERLTIATVGAASLLFFGVHFLLQAAAKGKDGGLSPTSGGTLIPMYAPATSKSGSMQGHGLTGFSVREMKLMFKHFMSDSTSLRIFSFLTINFLFMFVELIYGWYSNSLGLISDAGHMLFDCTALAIGLYASFVSKLKPNQLYTYGYGRYEVVSGYTNAVFLLFIGYFIFVESLERLFSPPEITSDSLVLVSVLGLCVNIVGLVFFHDHAHGHSHGGGGGHDHSHSHGGGGGGHDHSHSHGHGSAAEEAHRNSNMWAIYLHVLADALGSVGVIISSLLVKYKGWTSADAICSMIISVLIVASVIPLIRATLDTLNGCVPAHKEPAIRHALRRMTEEIEGVVAYREPHFWAFSDNELVATLHVHVKENADEQRILSAISDLFKDSGVGVTNLSVQLEKAAFLHSIDHEIKGKPMLTAGHL